MLGTIRRTIDSEGLLESREPGGQPRRWLVAVSGGPDSTALLHALLELTVELQLELAVAVVNHNLRPEAAAEADIVVSRCRALGLEADAISVDVSAARAPHVSLQDAARQVRLAALAERAAARGCSRVALGHTADDQAETLLFRIVRGTALRGLRGIPYARGPFVRPLLDVRREEILQYLRRRALPFFEDPSNSDGRFTRSRVRHQWLPFLAKENPRVVEALLGLAADARALDEPAAPPPAAAVGRRAARKVAELVRHGQGTRWVHFPGGIAEVAYGQVQLLGRGEVPDRRQAAAPPPELPIPGPGNYLWPGGAPRGGSLEIEVVMAGSASGPPQGSCTFDSECLQAGLRLRAPRPGDRMRPRGGTGSRKLQDLLVDAKIPRTSRARLPVLCTGEGTILFVPGLRPSEVGRPPQDARRWVEIRIHG